MCGASRRDGRVFEGSGLERRVVRVYASHEEAAKEEDAYWRALTPQQRLDAAGQCVRAYLWLRHEPEQRLRRVCRVFERA